TFSAVEAFMSLFSLIACRIVAVKVAVSSSKLLETFAIFRPKGIMQAMVSGTEMNMTKVIFQSMINKMITAPLIEIIQLINHGKCCEIKSFTTLVSLTTRLTMVPHGCWSK